MPKATVTARTTTGTARRIGPLAWQRATRPDELFRSDRRHLGQSTRVWSRRAYAPRRWASSVDCTWGYRTLTGQFKVQSSEFKVGRPTGRGELVPIGWRPTSTSFGRSPAACAGHAPLRHFKHLAQLACIFRLKHGPFRLRVACRNLASAPAKGLRPNEALVGRGRCRDSRATSWLARTVELGRFPTTDNCCERAPQGLCQGRQPASCLGLVKPDSSPPPLKLWRDSPKPWRRRLTGRARRAAPATMAPADVPVADHLVSAALSGAARGPPWLWMVRRLCADGCYACEPGGPRARRSPSDTADCGLPTNAPPRTTGRV